MKYRAIYLHDENRVVMESASGRPIDISDDIVDEGGIMRYLRYADTETDGIDGFILSIDDDTFIPSLDINTPLGVYETYEKALETILERL